MLCCIYHLPADKATLWMHSYHNHVNIYLCALTFCSTKAASLTPKQNSTNSCWAQVLSDWLRDQLALSSQMAELRKGAARWNWFQAHLKRNVTPHAPFFIHKACSTSCLTLSHRQHSWQKPVCMTIFPDGPEQCASAAWVESRSAYLKRNYRFDRKKVSKGMHTIYTDLRWALVAA